MLFLLKNRTHSEIYSRDNTTAYSQDLVITGIVMERRGGVGLCMSFPFRVVGLSFPVLYSSLAYPFLQEFTPRKLQPKNTCVQGSILELHGIHSRSYLPTCPSVFSHSHTFVVGKKPRQAKGGLCNTQGASLPFSLSPTPVYMVSNFDFAWSVRREALT